MENHINIKQPQNHDRPPANFWSDRADIRQ